jgi:hypothetical protein
LPATPAADQPVQSPVTGDEHSEWVVNHLEHLRIVSDELFDRVQRRFGTNRDVRRKSVYRFNVRKRCEAAMNNGRDERI